MSTAPAAPPHETPLTAPAWPADGAYEVEVFYDGDCPLCVREINMLRRKDKAARILFTDIAAEGFVADDYGADQATLMREIHGRLPDGSWIVGVEVFRRLYTAVGLGWLVSPTRLPIVRHALDVAYRLFARHRLRLTGRCASRGACRTATPPGQR
ncbi:MAG: DUF393 domain-containing protein [Planctomycetota bacterium]